MKYLQALLAREEGRPSDDGIAPDSRPDPTDRTDKSPDPPDPFPSVGSVGAPLLCPPITAPEPTPASWPIAPDSNLMKPAPGWWREEYEERAAIMEHDGGLPRAEAERRAHLGLATGQGAALVLD